MSKKPHPHHPGLEEVDYLQDPDAVIEVGEPDPETGLIRWIEVAYGYRNGKEHMDYVPHDDPASRHYLATSKKLRARRFKRRHRSDDWNPTVDHTPEKTYRVVPKASAAPSR